MAQINAGTFGEETGYSQSFNPEVQIRNRRDLSPPAGGVDENRADAKGTPKMQNKD